MHEICEIRCLQSFWNADQIMYRCHETFAYFFNPTRGSASILDAHAICQDRYSDSVRTVSSGNLFSTVGTGFRPGYGRIMLGTYSGKGLRSRFVVLLLLYWILIGKFGSCKNMHFLFSQCMALYPDLPELVAHTILAALSAHGEQGLTLIILPVTCYLLPVRRMGYVKYMRLTGCFDRLCCKPLKPSNPSKLSNLSMLDHIDERLISQDRQDFRE